MPEKRRNIKCDASVFDRLSDLREKTDHDWNAFLMALADAYESGQTDEEVEGETDGDLTNEELYSRLQDDLHNIVPREAADEIENRLR